MDTLPKGITGFGNYYKNSFFGRLFKIKEKQIPQVDVHRINKVVTQLETIFKTVTLTS